MKLRISNALTALIVDDQQGIRELLSEVLRERFAEVLTAGGGKEALAVVNREKIDFILLDLNMPDINGLAILKELRKGGFNGRVLLMTGFGEEAVSEKEMKKLGINGFLSKPFDLDQLNRMIDSCLG